MFHGTRDLNVGVRQSEEMHRALEAAGRQSRLILFEGLEHDLEDSAARARMLDEIARFLESAVRR